VPVEGTADGQWDAGRVEAESTALAPFRHSAFRWIWLGVLASLIGTWMQTVGAQWLLVDEPNAATLVALVQVANTLPVMLLALPAGVLADSFDRRWLMFSIQGYFLVVGLALVVLTAAHQMPPALLLTFTFALGVGAAIQLPTWLAIVPELVPRNELGAATRLEIVGVNLARSAGPAAAGVIIAWSGVTLVFAINAISVVFLAIPLLLWRRPRSSSKHPRERFVPALNAGGRYVWHELVVRRILLRALLFIAPASALWALLPIVAKDDLGLGADGYGALFAALGVGAIFGALGLGRARNRFSSNEILGAAGVLYAVASAIVVVAPGFVAALVALVFAGLAWTSMISTLNAELQFFLPEWVRARGLAIYVVVFMGSQAVGGVIWGLAANATGVDPTLLVAAALVLAGAVAGFVWRVAQPGHLASEPANYWGAPRMSIEPAPHAGPIAVVIEYFVTPDREADYLVAMEALRRSRRRTGATRWDLYRDGDVPTRFVELFSVPSWAEHLRQHSGRLTEGDRAVEEAALAFSDPPARADHLLPP
jgi:MFS family permease